ncbi:MAG: hypothetical protein HY297_05205 [Thaumarchaeota archaeon]|nr:hypothetical protein [Nitrososphaerota archaeon]
MKVQGDDMRCPNCKRFELRESGEGVSCRICGYALSPGEADKFRLFRLLKDEARRK